MTILRTIEFEGADKSTLYDSVEYDPNHPDAMTGWKTDVKRDGTYSLRWYRYLASLFSNYSWYVLNLGSAVPSLWIETYYLQQQASTGSRFMKSGWWRLRHMEAAKKFILERDFQDGVAGTYEHEFGTWYKLTINATPTRFRLWIDDVLDIDASANNSNSNQFSYGTHSDVMADGANWHMDSYLRVADGPFTGAWAAFRLAVG